VEQVHDMHMSSPPRITTLEDNDDEDDYVGHENLSDRNGIEREARDDHGFDAYEQCDDHDEREGRALGSPVYSGRGHYSRERINYGEPTMRHSPTWEDNISGNGRAKERSPSSLDQSRERVESPRSSRRSPLRITRPEDLDPRSDGEASQTNGESASGRSSRLSRASLRSFNRSLENETRMTSPMSPKSEPMMQDLDPLQNPRGSRFHCRLCMADPCDEATATFCGHIFCHSCITQEVMETSRCPVCNAPTLLYCLFRLDLHA